ncbi:MAG: hypothetical protein PUC99_10965 [Eubacteriales bacterium]|jgi:Zn finger protein HypA/HybF involved in hydrogenase expression|nr:hypothetical protein [Lachnospiraceae bacterium]MDD5860830.1 hypothetical protein [Eubacteriales bacterium]MCH4063417.1 hypothetical protein [Lachnospiraceae bacterium]MCH4104567.1 hypothetical protein [Lachnospiraceae bacterium]MCI1309555.1 hypothetical protein [Lachnospiraceae bacterium]
MMNLASIIILALIIAAVVFAIRYTSKHGTCETCGLDGKAHCGSGSCGTCAYHDQEVQFDKEMMKKVEEMKKFVPRG